MRLIRLILKFLWRYKWFSLAVAALAAAGILELAHLPKTAHVVLAIISVIELFPLLYKMWNDLQSGRYGIDILAATAIIASVLLHQYWAAIIIVIMLTGGEALEQYAEYRARSELYELLTREPQHAHLVRNRDIKDVDAHDVQVRDMLEIRPGEVVPVDAVIIEGSGSFDEAALTGESVPLAKGIGDTILSGSINVDGVLRVQALHSAADSQYQQIIKLVRSAADSKSPFVRLADRFSIPFTVAAFAIAIAAWIIGGSAIRFLEVIVVATPCPLLLAAPIALVSGMSRASRYGIIVKTGSALERLGEAKTIAFDKTGTLTKGKPVVDVVTAYNGHTMSTVLGLAASLEQASNSVLADAIVDAARRRKALLTKAKHVSEIAGHGMMAQLKGKEVLIGRFSFMQEHDVELPVRFKVTDIKQTVTFVAVDGKLAGVITFTDELRPEAKSTLKKLRELGLRNIVMITGDNSVVAKAIAKAVGIKEFQAEALPADKLHAIEKLSDRPVVFVGDGINDAPVLTASDIGIALGARGSTAASEAADIVIMQDDISYVAYALEIAQRTFKIAWQSIIVGIGLSLVLMLIFATGKFSPVTGAIVQEFVDIIVIFNALRAHNIEVSEK